MMRARRALRSRAVSFTVALHLPCPGEDYRAVNLRQKLAARSCRGSSVSSGTMNSSHIKNDIASAIRQYGATVRASLSTDEAGPVSYAGLWLLLASLAPVVTEAEEFRNTLGLTVKEAGDDVAGLLEHPHPTVAAALGAWLAQDVTLAGDLPVTLEKLPSQDALDKWAGERQDGWPARHLPPATGARDHARAGVRARAHAEMERRRLLRR